MEPRPTLFIVAGPNGAGKTSLYEAVISRLTDAEFVNPDRLISTGLGRHPETLDEARLGQALAEARREALLAEGRSLVAESTFSHPSKLDLVRRAKGLGFRVLVFHLGLDSGDLAVARVAFRAARGGHPVPEDKIRGRYGRNGAIIREAALMANWGYVFDNSELGRPPRRVLSLREGRLVHLAPPLPTWVAEAYAAEVSTRSARPD